MCKKNQIVFYFRGGLTLFKGLRFLFLPNGPGTTFIQGATSIPDSRVRQSVHCKSFASLPNFAITGPNQF